VETTSLLNWGTVQDGINTCHARGRRGRTSGQHPAVPQGEVRFENVSFGYGENEAGHRQLDDGTRWRKSA
jgi:hypothetical protein